MPRARPGEGGAVTLWGDNSVSSCRSYVSCNFQPKVVVLMRARFLWRFPYLERAQGVLDGVRRGVVGPPGPLELAALHSAAHLRWF
jgi:hypothetical protein